MFHIVDLRITLLIYGYNQYNLYFLSTVTISLVAEIFQFLFCQTEKNSRFARYMIVVVCVFTETF